MAGTERLTGLWEGEWPYHCSDGVGLRFDGVPTSYPDFERVLASEGCHPKATARIASRIQERGYDLLTVMSSLNFRWLKRQLVPLGVSMQIIRPQPDWSLKSHDGPFPEHLIPSQEERWNKVDL